MPNNINYLEEIAIFIEKIKQLSQQKINNYQLFTECFNLLKNFKSNIEGKQQQLHDKLAEIKERLVNYEYKTDGDSLQDVDQFKKIELYLKQLIKIMINDYIIINNNCINFLLINNDKQKLVELFTFNYAINCKAVERLIIKGSTKQLQLLTNIITLEKIIDDYNKLLYVATMHDQINILKYLLEISIDKKSINLPNQNGLTVFTCAIMNGKLAAAKVLLDHGADVNLANQDGVIALVFAITKGDLRIVKFLLDHGANINASDRKGNIPLMFAIAKGDLEIVNLLLAKKADVNLANKNGDIPLTIAIMNGHLNVIKFLLDRGANINLPNQNGDTPLMIAIAKGNLEIVKFLFANYIDINCSDQNSVYKFLTIAIINGHLNVIKFLLDHGANINASDQKGNIPLMIAIVKGYLETVKFLLDHGANINASDQNGNTPLMIAIAKGDLEMVTFLLDHSANINVPNQNGDTALKFASNLKAQNKNFTNVLTGGAIGVIAGSIVGPTASIFGALIGAFGGSLINKKEDNEKQKTRSDIFDVIAVAANNINLSVETTTEAKNINSL